jgi:hypothetical protein
MTSRDAKAREDRRDRKASDDYPRNGLAWDVAEARAAYDATPPARWALLFWQAVSIRLQRPYWAAYKQLRLRLGWPAKVTGNPKLRCECGKPKKATALVCWGCYLKATRRANA